MGKYKLSHVESLILEGDKQKQKDAKYNEMLEMLNDIVNYYHIYESDILDEAKQLIKEATQI